MGLASSARSPRLPAALPDSCLYAIVPGAVVRGSADPGALAVLRTPISLRGKAAVHAAWTRADAGGALERVTPLPAGARGVGFDTDPRVDLSTAPGERRELQVPEAAVRFGSVLGPR